MPSHRALAPRGRGGPREVCFVKYYEKGSTVMGADQVTEGLRARGWEARSIPVAELASVRNGILVFIKTSRLDHLVLCKGFLEGSA